jgi:hypothetical protein
MRRPHRSLIPSAKDIALKKHGYAGLFMVALATLMYEILLTRIFSVTTWYHFAFMAISIAMFGMTVGAILVYLFPNYFTPERVKYHLGLSALLFAVFSIVGLLTHLVIPLLMDRTLLTITGLYSLLFTYFMISVPFTFSGVCVCLCLTRFPRQVGKLYAADLIGAATGCILVIYTLQVTDGPTAVVVAALLAAVGATFFAVESAHRGLIRASVVATLLLAVFAGGHTILVNKQEPLLKILWIKHGAPAGPRLYEKWNSFSAVTVSGDPDAPGPPMGWGLSPVIPQNLQVRQLWLIIDAFAGTLLTGFNGDVSALEHLKYDMTNLVHYIRPDSKVLIVGAGGGRDVLSALKFNQKEAVAVEINPNIIEILNGKFGNFTGHLDRYPNVRFVNDEARSFIARQKDKFDIIQISLVDTSAATAAGAFVLTENSLYTIEAWKTFLEHLTPRGVLTVSRIYTQDNPAEVYRLTSLAAGSLMQLGVKDPRRHIILARTPTQQRPDVPALIVATNIMVSREPFTDADVATIMNVASKLRFNLALTPQAAADATFAGIASGYDSERVIDAYPLNIAAPTDDSPFFFNMLRLKDALSGKVLPPGWWQFNLIAVYTLGALLIVVVVLTALCIAIPLLLTTRKADLRGALPLCIFFASIGLGFMLVEISQMQRLIIFLGHPVYGLAVVLFSLLLSSGCGSLGTQAIKETGLRRSAAILLLLLVGALIAFGAITPLAVSRFQASTTALRIAVSVGILLPLGLFMGTAFPIGMKMASARSASLTPWLWGINGATSVCASVLAIAIALSAGISVSFWTGVACYLVALAAFAGTVRTDGFSPAR